MEPHVAEHISNYYRAAQWFRAKERSGENEKMKPEKVTKENPAEGDLKSEHPEIVTIDLRKEECTSQWMRFFSAL